MKKLSFISLAMFFAGVLIFTACDTDPWGPGGENSILPEKFSVNIPDAISQDISAKKSVAVDTMKGNEVYEHLTFFIHVDVYGNTSHPNAKLFTSTTGYNWAFVASGEDKGDVAAAEVGLPLCTLDATGREALLEQYSIRNVFINEVKSVWPNASDELLNAWLTNTEAPGFFNKQGFVQGGTAPGAEYDGVAEHLPGFAPYNPKTIANLQIVFN